MWEKRALKYPTINIKAAHELWAAGQDTSTEAKRLSACVCYTSMKILYA